MVGAAGWEPQGREPGGHLSARAGTRTARRWHMWVPCKAGVNWLMHGPCAHVREGAPMTVTVCGVGGSMCGLSPPYSPLKERPFRCGHPWGCSRW